MSKKIQIGILFGGCSAEHEISLLSAKNVVEALDKDRYEIILIGVDKKGCWHLYDEKNYLENENDPNRIRLIPSEKSIRLMPGREAEQLEVADTALKNLDVIFPILHGPLGEDGTVQGLLRLLNLPCVGSGVVGSAVCMDKDFTKRLLLQAGLPTCQYLVYKKHEMNQIDFHAVSQKLGLPLFIKPANMGSSVGIEKAHDEASFNKAIENAFLYDQKILIEEFIPGRELETAVLGNANPKASSVGEIIPQKEFYSYEAKYLDDAGARLEYPAEIDESIASELKALAIKSFEALECRGLARCDFFLTKDNQLFINEVNTMPGFTKISMYPKLWELSGVSYSALIDQLIQLGIEEHREKMQLKTTVS